MAALLVPLVLAACGADDRAAGAGSTAALDPDTAAAPEAGDDAGAAAVSTTAAAPTTATPTTLPPITLPARARTVDELLALGRPLVLAHAGGEDVHPHSTPYAYAESVRAGVDVLDLDVQLSGDGVLIVQHDATLERTTEAATGVRVADLTYDEIRRYDNAYWFTATCVCRDQPASAYVLRGVRTGAVPPPAGYGPEDFVVPTFREIAERFPQMPLNVEIKGTFPEAVPAAERLAAELRELDRLDSAVVTSFDDQVLAAFAAAAPEVERTPGLGATAAFVLSGTPLPAGMRILQLPPVYEGTPVLTPEVIGRATAAGYPIWVWPNDRALENLASYEAFLDQGISGLNANVPTEAVEAVRRHTGG